jgi:hypothetical protein
MSRVIKDDAELERAIAGMKKICSDLEDPLSDVGDIIEDIERAEAILTKTAELVQKYSRGRVVQSDPSRASYYKVMGWEYQKFGGD